MSLGKEQEGLENETNQTRSTQITEKSKFAVSPGLEKGKKRDKIAERKVVVERGKGGRTCGSDRHRRKGEIELLKSARCRWAKIRIKVCGWCRRQKDRIRC